MPDDPIIAVVGPTASGKTELALALARAVNGELVGVDSVQIYRGFNIGSAKPSNEELGSIQHHLISAIDPDQFIDAAGYARLADDAIAQIRSRNRIPIVVGGTGLWFRAVTRGLVDLPPVDVAIRSRLESEAEHLGSATLHARLGDVDPLTANTVHPNDALRIVRALEVFEQTGTPLGELRRQHALGAPRYRVRAIALDADVAWLGARIERRIDAMIELGLVEEVVGLRARWGDGIRALGSVGYKEVMEHLRDGVSIDETRLRMRKSTRLYARRQRTWFRSDPSVETTIVVDDEHPNPLAASLAFLKNGTTS